MIYNNSYFLSHSTLIDVSALKDVSMESVEWQGAHRLLLEYVEKQGAHRLLLLRGKGVGHHSQNTVTVLCECEPSQCNRLCIVNQGQKPGNRDIVSFEI